MGFRRRLRYFRRLWEDGTWPTLHAILVMAAREQAGREASPTAGIVDGQSARTSEAGGPRGYDAGKKVNGRKRHILVDTLGLLLVLVVHTADIQDRDGLALVCRRLRRRYPWLRLIFADGGYRGETAARAAAREGLRLTIVTRDPGTRGFAVLPRRWVVERTFAWLGRNRRLAKDFEATVTSAVTMAYLASLQLLVRRLARARNQSALLRTGSKVSAQLVRCLDSAAHRPARRRRACAADGSYVDALPFRAEVRSEVV